MKFSKTALSILAVAITGCHSPTKSSNADFFTPAQDQTELDGFADRQAAAATHADPSLYPAHFTGANLNSLGTAKLDSLLISSERPVATDIYLIGASDTPEHRQAIIKYLTCHGRKADQFTFIAGSNPNVYTMASRSVSDLEKASGPAASTGDSSAGGLTAGIGSK